MDKHRVRPLYRELAVAIEARRNCLKPPINQFGLDIHEHTIKVCEDLLPSGSGWDSGTTIELDMALGTSTVPVSHSNKIVLRGSYHHMNDAGMYDGWTDHTIIVTPSLTSDFDLRISGRNRNDIKDYLYQTFDYALRQDVAYWLYQKQFPQFAVFHKWIDECTQEFLVNDIPFSSLNDARSFAADLMEQAFYAPKENS